MRLAANEANVPAHGARALCPRQRLSSRATDEPDGATREPMCRRTKPRWTESNDAYLRKPMGHARAYTSYV